MTKARLALSLGFAGMALYALYHLWLVVIPDLTIITKALVIG